MRSERSQSPQCLQSTELDLRYEYDELDTLTVIHHSSSAKRCVKSVHLPRFLLFFQHFFFVKLKIAMNAALNEIKLPLRSTSIQYALASFFKKTTGHG